MAHSFHLRHTLRSSYKVINGMPERVSRQEIEYEMDKDSHYMDKREPGSEISEEVTRESLIAISYFDPEKDLPVKSRPENSNCENVVKSVDDDGDNKYRSELISISYAESPETEVSPGEIKDY